MDNGKVYDYSGRAYKSENICIPISYKVTLSPSRLPLASLFVTEK